MVHYPGEPESGGRRFSSVEVLRGSDATVSLVPSILLVGHDTSRSCTFFVSLVDNIITRCVLSTRKISERRMVFNSSYSMSETGGNV